MTISGLPMNASVSRLPSLRFGKLRLNDVTIVLVVAVGDVVALHWPMHGPQALASTVAPIASRSAIWPSRSMVASICSEPGVIRGLGRGPTVMAWRAIVGGAGDVLVGGVGARADERRD
jgi:hypothetical protein